MPILNRIADLHGEITAWRHDIHAHPELLYEVHRTAGSVADKLKGFGCDEVVTGIGRTGVVGVIRGAKGAGGSRVIGLRADMDALPIQEANEVPYRSTVPGKMHACGHDGHTAMLLGAARYLAETRNFAGTAVVPSVNDRPGRTQPRLRKLTSSGLNSLSLVQPLRSYWSMQVSTRDRAWSRVPSAWAASCRVRWHSSGWPK